MGIHYGRIKSEKASKKFGRAEDIVIVQSLCEICRISEKRARFSVGSKESSSAGYRKKDYQLAKGQSRIWS
jgi:hypothetical protein